MVWLQGSRHLVLSWLLYWVALKFTRNLSTWLPVSADRSITRISCTPPSSAYSSYRTICSPRLGFCTTSAEYFIQLSLALSPVVFDSMTIVDIGCQIVTSCSGRSTQCGRLRLSSQWPLNHDVCSNMTSSVHDVDFEDSQLLVRQMRRVLYALVNSVVSLISWFSYRQFVRRLRLSDPWFSGDFYAAKRLTPSIQSICMPPPPPDSSRANADRGLSTAVAEVAAAKAAWYTQRCVKSVKFMVPIYNQKSTCVSECVEFYRRLDAVSQLQVTAESG
jgi:hypothetical protein